MAGTTAIDRFTRALKNTESPRLNQLRQRLFPSVQVLRLDFEAKGEKGKVFVFFSEEAPREQRYMVKFNPLGAKDPFIDDVYKEYRILNNLHPQLPGTVPEPLFSSSPAEERIVGTAFFVMTFIDGRIFRNVGEIQRAGGNVVQMHVAMMRKLAEVHGVVLHDRELIYKHETTQSFWQERVDAYKRNYRSTVGWWRWFLGRDPESYLFSDISNGRKPMSRRVSVVHGNLDIGNFAFNEEMTEVRGILNWKYEDNGDPLTDVASLLLPFMDIGNYTIEEPVQLVHSATDAEVEEVVAAYRQSLARGFNDEDLQFAKAVCCLRQLCVLKRGVYDKFEGHESRQYAVFTKYADRVINVLCRHGKASYQAFMIN